MDQETKQCRKPNPKEKANFVSLVTFFYVWKTLFKGFKKDLKEDDIFEVTNKLKCRNAGDKLEKCWREHNKPNKLTSVLHIMWVCYGWRFVFYGTIELILKTSQGIAIPYATGRLVQYFVPGQTMLTKDDAIFYTCVLILAKTFDSVFYHSYLLMLLELATLVRTAFCSIIYRKCLKLGPAALSRFNTGNIITLMTKDVQCIDSFFMYGNQAWIATIQIFVFSTLMFLRVGVAAIVGTMILVASVPLEIYLCKKTGDARVKTCKKADLRLQATQEILSCIKILKIYTWEILFCKRISEARKSEIKTLRKVFYLKACTYTVGSFTSYVSVYVMLLVYMYYMKQMSAEDMFYLIGMCRNMEFAVSLIMPQSMSSTAELMAALKRIKNLLDAEEVPTQIQKNISEQPSISLENVSCKVNQKVVLNNIRCTINEGLNILTGSMGSGKTSLLKVILNDYPLDRGQLQVFGTVSYASQEPWLFPATIKENILFGAEDDPVRYKQVLQVCSLNYDLKVLVKGDSTIVENRGVNLSRGQQVRINLARAVYRDCDIYLLDDCLASMDVEVQGEIFQHCIKEFLNNKICILVSHNLKHFQKANQLIIMDSGTIHSAAKPNELTEKTNIKVLNNTKENLTTDIALRNYDECKEIISEETNLLKDYDICKGNLYQEVKQEGSVDWNAYFKYLKYGGGLGCFAFVLSLYALDELMATTLEKTVSDWIDVEENMTALRRENKENSTEYLKKGSENEYLWSLYTGLVFVQAFTILIKNIFYYFFISKASINIHKKVILNVVNATMEFFDNTFIGNILNRFSRDLNTIDEQLPFVIEGCLRFLCLVAGVFGLVSTVNPTFLIPAFVVITLLVLLAKFYLPTGRSLKRLDSATRSPVVGHVNASLEGLTTIRAFGNENIVQEEFDRHQDLYTSAYHMSLMTTRAFALSVDFLCLIYNVSVLIGCMTLAGTPAGSVGLALTQASLLTGAFQWGICQLANLENQMTSVERILEYAKVKTESKTGIRIKNWPKFGSLTYRNVSLNFSKNAETVLRNVNLVIPAKTRIGIVGRTGAGKSSLISALFRLYEVEGSILIDGADIKTIALESLRSNISLIPQEPLIFTGTLRYNLDPENNFTDQEIWEVMEVVKLRNIVDDLSRVVKDQDSQFSAGQKQLISLARALLSDNKIVILDEATANLDPETSVLINKIVKEKFYNCTVLIVAHKLESVLDCDKVVVLSKGEVIEFDSPTILLANKNSVFSQMIRQGE